MANNANTPTLKHKKFAKAYIENQGNASKAALEAYNIKPEDAPTIGYQNMQKPIVQQTITELLNKAGIDLETLTDYGNEALQNNLTLGKPSQAVGADLLKFYYKLHNAIPKEGKGMIKQERKVLLDKDYNVLREELSTIVTRSQDLLQDL